MSAALVAHYGVPHGLRDDLESSIYVLLWVALMYSQTSNPIQASLFLQTVLDHAPCGDTGSFNKAHFLIARTFLTNVKFIDRSALDHLIYQMACLFGTRYVAPPTEDEKRAAETLRLRAMDDPSLLESYHQTTASIYAERMESLEGHEATITLFETALSDPCWLEGDHPLEQDFKKIESQAIIKSGWHSTSFLFQKSNTGIAAGAGVPEEDEPEE